MKTVLFFIIKFSLLLTTFSYEKLCYAKTNVESSYSSEKIVKITKVYKILEWFNGLGMHNCNYEHIFEKYLSSSYINKLLKRGNFVDKNRQLYYGTGDRGS